MKIREFIRDQFKKRSFAAENRPGPRRAAPRPSRLGGGLNTTRSSRWPTPCPRHVKRAELLTTLTRPDGTAG